MNAATIIRRALLDANVVKSDNTTTPIITQDEALSWVEDGTNLVEGALRNARVDYAVKILASTDTSFIWDDITYDPSSLDLINTTLVYSLPPDCLRVKRWRITTSTETELRLRHRDMTDDNFLDIEQEVSASSSNPQRWEIYWDIYGDLYLRVPNAPETTVNTEIAYVARSRKPYIEVAGTSVALTQTDATVTGTGTAWLEKGRYYPAEIMFNSSGATAAPVVISQTTSDDFITPQTRAWPLSRQVPGTPIASDTTFELASPYALSSDTAVGYMMASVPLVPVEHHMLIVEYVVYRIKKKLGARDTRLAFSDWKDKLDGLRQDITPRQSAEFEHVTDFDFGDY